MRRLAVLALIAAAAWWFLKRDGNEAQGGATIGYADGSSVTLDAGSPELDRLQQIAARATSS
jgi:hypothetical protein